MATSLTVGSSVSKAREKGKVWEKRHIVVNLTKHRRTPTGSRNLLSHLIKLLERPHERTNDRLARSEEQHEWGHCTQKDDAADEEGVCLDAEAFCW